MIGTARWIVLIGSKLLNITSFVMNVVVHNSNLNDFDCWLQLPLLSWNVPLSVLYNPQERIYESCCWI